MKIPLLRPATKIVLFGQALGTFLAHAMVNRMRVQNPIERQPISAQTMQRYSKLALKIFGIELETNLDLTQGPYLVVSNHHSYLDVLIISAQIPCLFVTSKEIKESPGLGFIVETAGCLFVDRKNKSNIENEIAEITEALKNNISVSIFPEATSTNGESLLRFRKPLFNSAIYSQMPVKMLYLKYESIDDEPLSTQNRDSVFWYADMDFMPHLWRCLTNKKIKVSLKDLGELTPDLGFDAQQLAETSHARVAEEFSPCI